MKKVVFVFSFLCWISFFYSQNNQLWKGYFSFNEIVDVASATDRVYAATEVSAFYKDLLLSNVDQITSISGFKPNSITSIYYSDTYKKLIAGNDNGLILIVNQDGTILTKVDIIEEVPVSPAIKGINSFFENDGKLYISTDYGISVLNLATNEFISTYFIGVSGDETKVYQTTVFNGYLYAVTQNFGIRRALLTNPFIYDYSQWQTFDSGNWSGITTFNNQLVALNTNSTVYRNNGSGFQAILGLPQNGIGLKVNQNYLTITTQNHVYVLDQSFLQVAHITNIPDYTATFSSAVVVNEQLFIGTTTNGLFSTALSNLSVFENLSPNGPLQNYIFRVKKAPNRLWAVYGKYTFDYYAYPLEEHEVSFYNTNSGWGHFPFEDLLGAKNLCDIAINPINSNEVYLSSYASGLLEFSQDSFFLFDETNTGTNGLQLYPTLSEVFINSPAFDNEGNLWVTNRGVDKALKVLRSNGQWQSYDIGNYITNGRFAPMAIDKNNTKWLPTRDDGLIAFNDTQNNKVLVIDNDSGLPATNILCVAIDNNNQLWIGTSSGLRVLSSVNQFLQQSELTVSNIVIQEGDLAQELFYEQTIVDIAVDGANRKWIAIENGGVFLVSSNGQQTIYNFTKKNSPLPSNNVLDIEIDGVTGEVFFATDKGMVSFLGTSTKASDDLENVYVYPNPVRPNYYGTIKIAGLTDKANVKITDIEGNLVFETTSTGGTIEWDGTAFGKYKVASGVYMVFVATQDGMDTTVKKVMIIR